MAVAKNVSVSSGPSKYAQAVFVGSHVFQADEPVDVGGDDIGPNPEELLMASLGACASITAQMYAKRKRWNLQSVHIDVAHERVLAADNAASGATIGMVDQFEMQICLAGDLSEDQRNRLLEIANRCPIHRMLTSGVKIHSRLSAKAAQAGKSPEVSQETLVGGIE
jgi:putative redox protein